MTNPPPTTLQDTQAYSEVEIKTKAIYVEQHKAYLKDQALFERFYKMAVDPHTYDLPPDFFKGQSVCDVGCGNTAYFQKAMYDLGADHITCIDIGEDWKPELDSALQSLGVPSSFYTFASGTTESIPFPDESFDFVASNGVIMHLDGISMAEKALRDLGRVTRQGGSLYVYVGIDAPGIVDRYIVPGLRQAYKEDGDFRDFIDNISPQSFRAELGEVAAALLENDPSADPIKIEELVSLFTLDTCTFLQNLLQVPIQQGPKLTLKWALEQFEKNGFAQVRRCPNKYWLRQDIRKFLSPFHFLQSNKLSQLLYGNGHVKVIGRKEK